MLLLFGADRSTVVRLCSAVSIHLGVASAAATSLILGLGDPGQTQRRVPADLAGSCVTHLDDSCLRQGIQEPRVHLPGHGLIDVQVVVARGARWHQQRREVDVYDYLVQVRLTLDSGSDYVGRGQLGRLNAGHGGIPLRILTRQAERRPAVRVEVTGIAGHQIR